MKTALLILFSLFLFNSHAQTDTQTAVRATIDSFFEGFHKRDTARMRSVLADSLHMQRIGRDASGSPVLVHESAESFLTSMANLPDTLKIEERLLEYRIQTDGDMAHAWTPYEFYLQGAFHHCGVNSFQLFHDGTRWKIIYLVDTRRVQDCSPGE
ncbi:MAG: nuclear transport factor 2 family protein [Robiginitalea sp.]|nr:nuclear transport factor 2 family protein [Robiginitalea sp.]